MLSKRGRKRDDNLPPNRARDVQRAFRARRIAHMQALQSRVTELEEENSQFRQLLNLPPSARPHLGSGPTGLDWPSHDVEKSRHRTSSSGRSATGSPAPSTSSPEVAHSLMAPSIYSRMKTMMDGGPSDTRIVNEGHQLSYHRKVYSNVTYSFSPQKTPSYLQTSETSIESSFDVTEPRRRRREEHNEDQRDISQNYPHTTGAGMYPQSCHEPNSIYLQWNPPSSDHIEEDFPESRQFPRPPQPYGSVQR